MVFNENEPLLDSLRRLEAADIFIAISEDGDLRIVLNEGDAQQAIHDGFVIYSPQDMYFSIKLEPAERRLLHEFKNKFGGTVEWTRATDAESSE